MKIFSTLCLLLLGAPLVDSQLEILDDMFPVDFDWVPGAVAACHLPMPDFMSFNFDLVAYIDQVAAQPIKNKCSVQEEEQMDHALSHFNDCAEFDYQGSLETFPSAVVGQFIHCVPYIEGLYNKMMDRMMTGMEPLSPSDYMSINGYEECRDAAAQSPYAEGTHRFITEPDKMRQCAAKLATDMPHCTKDIWPIPLVGTWIGWSMCFYDQTVAWLERDGCATVLEVMDGMLPTEPPESCADYDWVNLHGAMPLPDTCARVAGQDSVLKTVPERYAMVLDACADPTLIEQWNTHGGYTGEDIPAKVLGSTDKHDKTSAITKEVVTQQSLGGFAGGFLASAALVLVLFVASNRRRTRPESRKYDAVELAGADLELS